MGIYICCLCCLTVQTPKCVESSIFVKTVISIVCFIIGFASFPWSSISKSGIILFSIDLVCMFFCFIVVVYLKILRKSNLINIDKNKIAVILSCLALGINIVCIIINIVTQSIIMSKTNNIRKKCNKNINLGSDVNCPVKKGHIIAEYIIMCILDVIWILKASFWFFDNKLISLKVNCSYENFKNVENLNNMQKEVKIMPVNSDSPKIENTKNHVTPFKGEDINGHDNNIPSTDDLERKNIEINPLDQDIQSEKINNNEKPY